ncbi:MAG TPA: carboxypeptidase-like regulatory domain-containing protein [Mucilaginibacter sp.]|nr:carboxypeptidase-like regulatory domain-containing protein [Mucilaginibacter sp.]
MRRTQLLIIGIIIFFVCCSMSRCNTPGPETNISGIVTDTVTGKPVSGLQLKVINFYNAEDQYAPVTTGSNGSYNLSFRPANAFGSYFIVIAGNSTNNYYATLEGNKITLGKNNSDNLRVYKLVTVTVKLKSTINKNQPKLELLFSGKTFPFQLDNVSSAIVDTTYQTLIPRLNNYNIGGIYFNPAGPGGTFPYDFSSNVYIGNADTSINISNP